MPTLSQGDIFKTAINSDLIIVFGHLGFNLMHKYWKDFASKKLTLQNITDPFIDKYNKPLEWETGKWIWFVPEEQNHGIDDSKLFSILDNIFSWASINSIRTISTNGISNVNHTSDSVENIKSDNERSLMLFKFVSEAEIKYNFRIELISLNDVFTRLVL